MRGPATTNGWLREHPDQDRVGRKKGFHHIVEQIACRATGLPDLPNQSMG